MTYRKKLIEVALPLEAINEASAREKSIRHGHPSTLHLWWARRPLAACRAVIFTSLVDDPDDPNAPPEFVAACRRLPLGKNATANDTPRQRLFDFIERLVTWEATTDEAILNTARELIRLATDGNPPPLLDPFAGGGSIPLEAQRLGLEAHASDLNPVAVMINKALIEIPPKFADRPPVNPLDRAKIGGKGAWKGAGGLAADVRYYGEWMRERAWERIGHLYPQHNGETVIAWLWTRTVKCPNPACGAQMPLVRSFDLSQKSGKRAWVEPQIDPHTREISYAVRQETGGKGPEGTVNRSGAKCIACHSSVPFAHIRSEGKAWRIGAQLMVIVSEGANGRNYHEPVQEHEDVATSESPKWVPHGEISHWPGRTNVVEYGMTTFESLFTPRQLVALTTFSDLVGEARALALADARAAGLPDDDIPLREGGVGCRGYVEAVSVYLAFAVDKAADHWSSLSSWRNTVEAHRTTFSRQALPMVWDYVEINPFSDSAGNWNDACIDLLDKAISATPSSSLQGTANMADAAEIDLRTRRLMVSTDPPYYDNIGYADLSDYVYIWMRPMLRGLFPAMFSTMLVPKELELIASPYRFNGNSDAANRHFESGLQRAFQNMRMSRQVDFPLTIYYAFKQSEVIEAGIASTGWETMLAGLLEAGYSILGTWPMRTERGGRMISVGTNALASSIVLVCRPRPDDAPATSRRQFVAELRRELPGALREMQSGNIAPVDLAQASIGPGMAVYSRYSRVLEPNGDRLSVRTALQLINHALDEYLVEAEGELDVDSRFAVAWFEQYGFNSGEFGVADVLARAKNTSVAGLVQAGIAEAGTGRVRLLSWEELDPGWEPAGDKRVTVWEASHHLIERLNTHGEEGAALLLAKMSPDLAADARQLAYRLYAICERKGWADHARNYNALVISWSGSQERAAKVNQQQQGRLFD